MLQSRLRSGLHRPRASHCNVRYRAASGKPITSASHDAPDQDARLLDGAPRGASRSIGIIVKWSPCQISAPYAYGDTVGGVGRGVTVTTSLAVYSPILRPDPLRGIGGPLGFTVIEETSKMIESRIDLKEDANADVIELRRVCVIRTSAEELPVAILAADKQYRAGSMEHVPTAEHSEPRIQEIGRHRAAFHEVLPAIRQ